MARTHSLPRSFAGGAPAFLNRQVVVGTALVIFGVALSAPFASAADWSPAWIVAALVAMNVASEAVCIQVGRLRITPNELSIALALVLLGPFPAMVVCVSGNIVDYAARSVPVRTVYANVGAMVAVCGCATATLQLGSVIGWGEPGSGELMLTIIVMVAVQDVVGIVAVALTSVHGPRAIRHDVMDAHTLVLPWMIVTALLTAGAAHAYFTIGPKVVVGLGAIQVALAIVLLQVERSHRLDRELGEAVEERERLAAEVLEADRAAQRRLAEALHDDALQTLLAARQNVADVRAGEDDRWDRAESHFDAGLAKLRELMSRGLLGVGEQDSVLADRLDQAVVRLREQGVRCELDVAAAVPRRLEPSVLQFGAELAGNTAKHAAAQEFRLFVGRTGNEIVLIAEDDGKGFSQSLLPRKRAAGHLGLALLRERILQLGGSLRIHSSDGEGTRVEARLPVS